jgi:hypothetical protein
VYDLDNSTESRDLAARFGRSGYFDIVEHVYRDDAPGTDRRGRSQVLLRMDIGSRRTRAGRTTPCESRRTD